MSSNHQGAGAGAGSDNGNGNGNANAEDSRQQRGNGDRERDANVPLQQRGVSDGSADSMNSPNYEYEASKGRAAQARRAQQIVSKKQAAREKALGKKQMGKKHHAERRRKGKEMLAKKKKRDKARAMAADVRREEVTGGFGRARRVRRGRRRPARPPRSTARGARTGAVYRRDGLPFAPPAARTGRRVKALTLEDIHRCLPTSESIASILSTLRQRADVDRARTDEESGLETLRAVTSEGSTPFDDALQEYSILHRPVDNEDLASLSRNVTELAWLCGGSLQRWKLFVLTALRRRYHSRAPAAREAAVLNEPSKASEGGAGSATAKIECDGDGERLIFYATCLSLRRLSVMVRTSDSEDSEGVGFSPKCIKAAVRCMIEVAPLLGGTRDINALMEHLCFEALLHLGHVTDNRDVPNPPAALREKLLPAVRDMCLRQDSPDDSPEEPRTIGASLSRVLRVAASLLDEDLEKCSPDATGSGDLMSTIHVTLPHKGRGAKKGKTWQRNLTNCIAELLVWQETAAMKSDDRFVHALSALRQSPPLASDAEHRAAATTSDDAYARVLQMQTSARKKRKALNDRARSQGSLLCSRYLADRTSLDFQLIRRGKVGDLRMLKNLTSKFEDAKTLRMILRRGMDPAKAVHAESIGVLLGDWHDICTKVDDEESFEALELEMQAQTVRATVARLCPESGEGARRPVIVACLARGRADAVCAVLVSAALRPCSRLLINSREFDISTEEKTLEVLNNVALERLSCLDLKEVKTAEDILKDEAKPSTDCIFISSSDIQLDEMTLQELRAQDKTIRVHSAAKVGVETDDLEIKLNATIHERLTSGAPLSLAVLLDCTGSMGCEIEGCKIGALKLIEMFNDLAPVEHANFMGYWDPIGSHGDPDPASSGYLNPRAGNLDEIQRFVDAELPCMGGGDEPEDVPAALEKLIQDMEEVGLSSDEGVHFVFFIADAGHRRNEERRIEKLLKKLKRLGVVMVTCPVRASSTCTRFVSMCKDAFCDSGQYIGLQNIGQLQMIAATVTESIRASLFKSGNIRGVTSSIGDTIEAVSQLCNFQKDNAALKRVEELSKPPPKDDEDPDDEAASDEGVGDAENPDVEDSSDPDAGVFASTDTFGLTSRDRLYLQISRLPPSCHRIVEAEFGGGETLQEAVAREIAARMIRDDVPVVELNSAGYPPELVELVRRVMGGHGMKRLTDKGGDA